ncbi:hypothetical protein HHK36_024358 [Tetracentron sinense]|uniref:non-specific serine/threonine protein kinase n=1 Tax=Tetracentron sinense TaxID=13715 RepID=A0A835D7E9_TETSI|nr:hypothetical protein HHK36_024358 [Tetracentron sinense]
MASSTPSPNSSPSAAPPTSTMSPPPPSSPSPSVPSTTSPTSQPKANSPETTTPSTPSSPPPAVPATPPPVSQSASPPLASTSPPTSPVGGSPVPPAASPPPPQAVSPSPPPPANVVPPFPSNSPPPPSSKPPENSPPPPSSKPPENSPPPPSSKPPASSPPPPTSKPPASSPPPPSSKPPESSPPPPSSKPPESSQPPPSSKPPESSPPPPSSSKPPKSSPPPPSSKPPESSPPPPSSSEPPKSSPPPPSSKPPGSSPPPPSLKPPEISPPPSPNSPPISLPPPPKDPPGPILNPPSSPSPPLPSSPQSPSPTVSNTSPNGAVNTNSTGSGGFKTGGAVAVGIVVGFIVLSLIGLAVWCVRKKRKKAAGYNGGYVMPSPLGSSQKSDASFIKTQPSVPLVGSGSGSGSIHSPSEPGGLGNSRSWFTYEELVQVTNGFSTHNLLGEGGFGSVYKGCLADGREVAVKQLKIGGGQGEREFGAEVEIISRVHHRHLVSLVGYCISEHQRLLVYDYIPNNTLYYHLHGQGRPVMEWATRVKVAAGAARGIAYLHEDFSVSDIATGHPRIIHRDIKSSNILLDNNFEALVSDFGLAKLALDAYTHISTRVMGTFGYMAPEYASSGKLTEKSDVYSFGVVLLELITGRKAVDASQPLGDESLVEWVSFMNVNFDCLLLADEFVLFASCMT